MGERTLNTDVEGITKDSLRVMTFILVVLGPILIIQGALVSGDFLSQFKVPMMITGAVMLIIGVVMMRFTVKLSY